MTKYIFKLYSTKKLITDKVHEKKTLLSKYYDINP